MALFTPEVKDTGSTNVSAYSPPVMDYSGIGGFAKVLAQFEPEEKKISAEERQAIELQPLADIYAKGDEIRKQKGSAAGDYYVKNSIIQFRKNNPHLASEITSYQDGLKKAGLEENVFENTVKATVEAFANQPEGRLKQQERLIEYTDKFGNVDTGRMYSALFADAAEYNAKQARMNQLEMDSKAASVSKEQRDASRDQLTLEIVSSFAAQDASAAKISSTPQGVLRTIALAKQNAKDSAEALTFASGYLKQEEANRRSLLISSFNSKGIQKTEDEINNLMKQSNPNLYYSIAALDAVSALDEKYRKQVSDQSAAQFVSRMPPGGMVLLDNPQGMRLAQELGLITNEEIGSLRTPLQEGLGIINIEGVNRLPWDGVNVAPESLPEEYSPSSTTKNDQTQILSSFTPETLNYIASIPNTDKQNIMLKAEAAMSTYTAGSVGNTIPGNIQAASLSYAYGIQVSSTEVNTPANIKNIEAIFGNKPMLFINDMLKHDPTIGNALSKQASQYGEYESSKQMNRFSQIYTAQINGDLANSPFILEEKNNDLELRVRPKFENDRYISQARIVKEGMGATETKDPYRIMRNWTATGVVGPFTGGQGDELVEKVRAIQLLYRNSYRLPEQYGSRVRAYIMTRASKVGLR